MSQRAVPWDRTRPTRRRRIRPALIGWVALTVVAGCGHTSHPTSAATTAPATTAISSTTTTPATTAPSPTTGVPTTATTAPPTTSQASVDAAATSSWPAFASTMGEGRQRSDVESAPGGIFGAVSFDVQGDGEVPHAVIARFEDGAWSTLADLTLDVGGTVDQTTPITVLHITGATTPDFAVEVSYNDGTALAVASAVGGQWHLLPFHGSPVGDKSVEDEVIDATVTGQAITQTANNCEPDCAAGNLVTTTFSFSPTTGAMEAVH